jgi:hypothetical protein
MNRVFCIVSGSALLLILLMTAAVFSQEDMEFIDNTVFKNPDMSAARFEHDAHNENAEIEDCAICHHVYEDGRLLEGESSEDQSCSECHKTTAEGRKPGLRKAFHLNCRGCHLESKAGPILCGECHIQTWRKKF